MDKKNKDIKKQVKKGYGKIASHGSSCCSGSSCCGGAGLARDISKTIGYTDEEMGLVPDGANLGLGCGNPVAMAFLKEGDTVLDLGSGAGFDAFLAARKVGRTGNVIGVDMTPEMIKRARENAAKGEYKNVEFRQGEIEILPVESDSVDAIISNCVINLSPDKQSVFREAFRVLKSGGKLMVSDLVLTKELPEALKSSVEAYVGCIAGAQKKEDYLRYIREAGFKDIKIVGESGYSLKAMENAATSEILGEDLKGSKLEDLENLVVSVKILAAKP